MVSLRIKSLESLDPLTVPLPNGTEVTTGADRHTLDGARLVEFFAAHPRTHRPR